MPKKMKNMLIAFAVVFVAFIGVEIYYTNIYLPNKKVDYVSQSKEQSEIKTSKDSPKLSFYHPDPMPVMKDSSLKSEYDQFYLWIVAVAEDMNGNNILDDEHLTYTEVDWTKKGKHTITYTLEDDKGHQTIKKIEIYLE